MAVSSKRTPVPLLLEAFPAPPSHIPPTPTTPNPPPTGPPTLPLPPVPGPSRISGHEQLLLLTSASNRSQRSSKYSVSSHRESVASLGSAGARTSTSSTCSPLDSSRLTRSPPSLTRPAISVSGSDGRQTPGEQLVRMSMSPIPLSDIEDEDGDLPPPPRSMPSPTLRASFRRSKHRHQANESISSIDVRDIMGIDDDDILPPFLSQQPPSHSHQMSLADPIDPLTLLSQSEARPPPVGSYSYPSSSKHSPINSISSTLSEASPLSTRSVSGTYKMSANYTASPASSFSSMNASVSTMTQLSSSTTLDSILFDDLQPLIPSPTIKDMRMEMRAERTKSAGLKKELAVRSRSRSRAGVPPPQIDLPPLPVGLGIADGGIVVTKTVEMTLDELGPVPETKKASLYAKPRKSENVSFPTRVPSPDIATILSATPRPARKTSRSRVRSQGSGARSRVNSAASNPVVKRRVSEGVSWHGSRPTSYEGDEIEADYDAEMERVLEGQGSEDEEVRGAPRGRQLAREDDDSDSSLDLHTPLPHLMVRDGLLSPNSKLLPGVSRANTPMDGRPGSIMSIASNVTKSGVMKDDRNTPMRRVRHRDGKMLRGGIGLTTGLGWSDSEDEDAPSPLTRRLSALNLSRRSSASSIIGSTPRRHPLSRSYSSGALLESEHEHPDYGVYDEFDDGLEDLTLKNSGEWAQRQRLPSKTPRKSLPPTSWHSKSTASRSSVGTRTSTSSMGSHLSLEVSIPENDRSRTPSRLQKPSAARDSTGSSVDHHQRSIAKKRPSGDDLKTPSSTTSTLSFPMPTTPKDLEPLTPGRKTPFDKEKSLPPLPSGLKGPSKSRTTSIASQSFPRARTFSSTSTASIPSATTSPIVRPLQLPRHTRGGDRPAVPVPMVLSSSTSHPSLRTPSLSTPRPSPTSPRELASSTPPGSVRKPRTGTGMVYRSSSSKMRPPMALSSSMGGNSVSTGPAVSSIGRPSGMSRPIAL